MRQVWWELEKIASIGTISVPLVLEDGAPMILQASGGGELRPTDQASAPRTRQLFPETWLWNQYRVGYVTELYNDLDCNHATVGIFRSNYTYYNISYKDHEKFTIMDCDLESDRIDLKLYLTLFFNHSVL